ncbi:hypothetical protein K0M31_002267 [Melipona bicolor]|uniref:Uncharacterized protein n=1 Tax=Melipona bicolor TaxID=60889 RepID=A0AA40GH75_9HYME|nr:hypothetical protein K0M31_002267 [Melipona bicolor]
MCANSPTTFKVYALKKIKEHYTKIHEGSFTTRISPTVSMSGVLLDLLTGKNKLGRISQWKR